jgi:predicted nucleic acid-binding protein
MIIFADTSGIFALLVENDFMHVRAKLNFAYFAQHRVQLLTSSFVLVETAALLQRRVGLGAVHDFQANIMPLMEIIWVNGDWHTRAIQRLFALNKRSISLVDCLSFEIMESREISHAFTFDKHFPQNGFTIAAFHDLDIE